MHVERLFQIVFLLMSGSCGTAKELAEHCSVSVRTIQRDLDALSLAGIPIFSNRGRGGGTGLLKEFTLDKTFMTEQEQADILHGLQPLRVRDTPAAMRPFTSLPPCSGKRPKIAGCGWIFPRGADPGSAKKSSTS